MSQAQTYQVWIRHQTHWMPLNHEPEEQDYCEHEVSVFQDGGVTDSLLILPWDEVPEQGCECTMPPPRMDKLEIAMRMLFGKATFRR